MASLRDSVKNYQDELRDGIAWVAFWKQGRSWNAELFHLEVDGTLEPFDRSRLEEINPFLAFLLYVPTRILTGWLTGLIYQGIRKTKIPSNVSITIANLCCPLLNTTFFMSMLVFGFYQTEYIQSFVQTLGVSNPFLFVIAFVGINGLVEAVVCFIVGTAISAALKKALKYS